MPLLTEQNKSDVADVFAEIEEPVTIHVFTDDCQTCDDAIELNRDLAELSEKVTVEEHDLDSEAAEEYDAAKYDTGPVQVIERDGVSGVKFFGIASGQEINSYLSDVVEVSKGETPLPDGVKEDLRDVDDPVEIKVFVTPTCPHCPGAVQTAHRFAIENENVTAEMIESQEFMSLSQEYGVRGVPQINVNGHDGQFKGNLPPQQFLDQIQRTLAK